jgi:hypothetical protein
MGANDLHAEALLMKTKNEIEHNILSQTEITNLFNEIRIIAEETRCPEIIWKVYFEYGKFLQNNEEYLESLKNYRKCNKIFGAVISKIKNESYRKSYLNHPDRQAVYAAKNELKKLLG